MGSTLIDTEKTKSLTIPVILRGPNYLLWSRTIKTALCGKELWDHTKEDKTPKEEEDSNGETKEKKTKEQKAEEAKWFKDDQKVLGMLQNSVDPSILEAYSYCDSAKELWDTLKNVYGNVSNISRVFEIKKAINDLNQEDLEFTKHLGKFQSLWAELDNLRPSTKDTKVLLKRKEEDKVFGLLLTLNSGYNDLIKHILREEKLPNLDEVCARIQKEQGSIGLFERKKKDELILANKGMYKQEERRGFEERRGPTCDHCKKKGHFKDKCWILHPHLKPRFNQQRAHYGTTTQESPRIGSTSQDGAAAMSANANYITRNDLADLIKAISSKDSGITFFSHKPSNSLVVDSGASHHMISNSNLLNNIKPTVGNVTIANGDSIPIEGIGNLNLFNKESRAFYVPKFTSNLLSVKRTTNDLNCYAIFGPNNVHFQDIESGKLLGKGGTKDELYVLENSLPSGSDPSIFTYSSCFSANADAIWHARLGHPHSRALKLMMPSLHFDHSSCESCILGKHCRVVFPKSSTLYERCFDLVHSDLWTSPCMSRDNNKYFITFIDEKSKYTWITLLPSKDRAFEAFVNFQNYVTNQFNAKIKIFRSDNGGEYTSHRFKEHLAKHGIMHQTSCPNTPQQNGVAERKNRHLMEVARSMMFHTNVPKRFWGDAVLAACYLINRIPTKILQDLSPFQVLNNIKPSIDHLRVFGCVCFVFVQGEQRNKLEAKSKRCMFLGYSPTQRGYKCFDTTTNRIMVSRDVKLMEEKGYFDKNDWEGLKDLTSSPSDLASSLRYLLNHLGNDDQPKEDQPNEEESKGAEPSTPTVQEEPMVEDSRVAEPVHEPTQEMEQEKEIEEEVGSVHEEQVQEQVVQEAGQPLRRSARQLQNPRRVYYNHQAVAHPIQAVCSLALLPKEHQAFLGKIDQDQIPTSYEEAKQLKVWIEAIGDERGAMERNHTWEVEDLPPGKRAVTSKWIFTIKYKSNGDIERYKARLVARGFTQTYGEDYKDTFAPVAKLGTVRVVLSLATNLSWDLWQMDVKNAFLQGDLEEEVYMSPPPGLEDLVKPGQVLRLRKAIYGLKQSPRAWYHKLSSTLLGHGFKKSHSDHTLFTLRGPQGMVVVLVYVDDLIITGDDKEGIKSTKAFLHSTFDIKDLGELKYFLGIEVCRSPEGLFLSQRKYALDLLRETGKLGAKPAKTPLEDGYKVNRKGEKSDEPFKDVPMYRRLVGKLIYLTLTRPDLCYAVNQISQHMQEPTIYHWSMVERILRYIKGSPGQGIWMGKNDSTEIIGYCDADWSGDRMDRKSTTGYCTFIGGNLVTWKTKKQKVVSCSSAESEYRAMRKLTNELTWLKALLIDLGFDQPNPITFHCDNQAAIHIATNSVFHERTKHIEIDCHKVREKIEEGAILPCYTKSEDQLADIFTKAASTKVCNHIYGKLGLVDPTRP